MADQYGQAPLPPDQQSPDAGALMTLLRKIPGMSKFGMINEDLRLPMEATTGRDPRLPAPTQIDSIREGLEQVRSLSRPMDTGRAAIEALNRPKRR